MSAETTKKTATPRRAAFLDRDGVINVDNGYVYRWEDFQFIPGAIEGMRRLHQAGYALVVITNQSGIARGYYTEEDFYALSAKMCAYLAEQGCPITAVYHCPHLPNGNVAPFNRECECRKPMPGMLLQAAHDLNLNLSASLLIGDKPSDIQAAHAANVPLTFHLLKNETVTMHHQKTACTSQHARLADALDQLLPLSFIYPSIDACGLSWRV